MPFESKNDRIASLSMQVAQLQAENNELRARVVRELAIGGLADLIRAELDDPKNMAEMDDSAMNAARFVVTAAERARLEDELSVGLQAKHYDTFAARVRVEEGPAISARLDNLFQTDGTYAGIEARAREYVTATTQRELLVQYEEEIRQQLAAPESRERIMTELKTRLKDSPEGAEIYRRVQEELEVAWNVEAVKQVEEEARSEAQGTKDSFISDERKRLINSGYKQRTYNRRLDELREAWKNKTLAEVNEEVGSEVLKELLAERISLEQKLNGDMTKALRAKELLNEFESGGIDTNNIPAGSKVAIYLGGEKEFEVKKKVRDRYGSLVDEATKVKGIDCARQLRLLSLGEGRYAVESDTLQLSKNQYARLHALETGVVITIGRRLKENDTELFDKKVCAGTELYYDTDTRDPSITGTLIPVVNISIDGIFAREYEHVAHNE